MKSINLQTSKSEQARIETDVLIVGAGPTGLTLACALARSGINFQIIEAFNGPQPGSRGKGVQPRTLEVFDDLGIVDDVIAMGRLAMPIRKTALDRQVTETGTENLSTRPDVPYPTSLITPEWRVEEALRVCLMELGGAVEFDSALESFVQFQEGVSVSIVKGGQAQMITARWLVGCDGGHSTVRKQAGIAFEGETREEVRMIVADVAVDGVDRDAWHMWSHIDGLVSLCPLPSTELFQFQAGIALGQQPDLSLTNMQTLLERRSGRNEIRISKPQWASLWRANIRLANRYSQGRVFLAGDAAHIHSPTGGQGMNTGIQDAYNLGWKLAAVVKGASPALLESYEYERRPIAAGVLALSNSRLQQAIKQKSIPTDRDASTMQLGLTYRGTALVRDDRDGIALLRAGDRAPDATKLINAGGECRLFRLMRGTHFTLLNFGPAGAGVIETSNYEVRKLNVVSQLTGPNQVVDSENHLRRAYNAGVRTLVLIRPDGYVAIISDAGDESMVSHYFSMIS